VNTLTMQQPFRDETREILDLIKAYFAAPGPHQRTVYTGDQTPLSFDGKLPFIRTDRVGGATRSGSEHTDRPVQDVDVYAATRADAKEIAQLIEQLLLSRPHPIDHCAVLMAPQRVEWVEDSKIRRFYASYHLALRR
jgi:hypothetical protein